MALYHFHVGQIKRSAGRSAVEAAAYRAGEKLYSEYYGQVSDYTRKGGVIHSEILLPPHAPREYSDRQTLWNAVEEAERNKNAQPPTASTSRCKKSSRWMKTYSSLGNFCWTTSSLAA